TGDLIGTISYRDTFGRPYAIERFGSGNALYTHLIYYDSLGRLVYNYNANAYGNRMWRYVYDDHNRLVGTSDGRGCGKNVFYDGLGRVTGEDWSPCLGGQPLYTEPNFATGDGLEVVNRYDGYEPDQVSPDATFADDASLGIGKLVATRDRGA